MKEGTRSQHSVFGKDTGFILVANMFRIEKDSKDTVGTTELYLIHNITDADATDRKSLNFSNTEPPATVLKIEGSPQEVLSLIIDKDEMSSSTFPITPLSYCKPEIAQIGMSSSSGGSYIPRYKPTPLFINSRS